MATVFLHPKGFKHVTTHRAGLLVAVAIVATLLPGCASSDQAVGRTDQAVDGSVNTEQEVVEDHLADVSESEVSDESAGELRAETEERLSGNGWTLEQFGDIRIIDRPEPNYDRAVVPVTISREGCGPFEINIIGDVPGDWRVSAMIDTSAPIDDSTVSEQTPILLLEGELCGG